MIPYCNRYAVGLIVATVFATLFALSPALAKAKTFCVNANAADDPGAGTCWSAPYKSLQSALAVAVAGDEIWVAEGIYTPGITASDTFTVPSGVALYGGFAATETLRTERDWAANVTVLSGDADNNDIKDTTGVVTSTTGIVGSNVYHVVRMDGSSTPVGESTRLDGFTITAGSASGNGDSMGGGFDCNAQGSGAVCSPTLANVTFSGNFAATWGGAMNSFNLGGTSMPMLAHVVFSGNTAMGGGGAMSNFSFLGGAASPSLIDVSFRNNSVLSGSGEGGAVLDFATSGGTSSPTMTNVVFVGNTAAYGGALCNSGIDTEGPGGGTSSPVLTNVIFSSNSAVNGGAVYNTSAAYENRIDGASRPVLTNVTFSGNSAQSEGAVMYNVGAGTTVPVILNSILWGNRGLFQIRNEQIWNEEDLPIINFSIVQGGVAGIASGTGNVDADPLFADAVDGDLRLLPGSPAIDSGTNAAAPATDIRGFVRPINLITDMGAYEMQGFTLTISGGNEQTVNISDTFTTPLQVRVVSGMGEPIGPGGTVTFTPPTSGAGLSVRTAFTGTTDASGAVTKTVVANAVAGSYNVTVTARGAASPITFKLTNHSADQKRWLYLPQVQLKE